MGPMNALELVFINQPAFLLFPTMYSQLVSYIYQLIHSPNKIMSILQKEFGPNCPEELFRRIFVYTDRADALWKELLVLVLEKALS